MNGRGTEGCKARRSVVDCSPRLKTTPVLRSQATRRGSRAVSTSAAALASHQLPYTETYLHNSRIPTLHFQGSLPRLPIPNLNDTLDK